MKKIILATTLAIVLSVALDGLSYIFEARALASELHPLLFAQDGTTLAINDVSATEGDAGTTNMNFTVTLTSQSSHGAIFFSYATANGTATAPPDYASASGGLMFPAGAGGATMTISITINGDTSVETNETFFVNLSNADGAVITDAQGTGTIIDDDSGPTLPTLSINDVFIQEGDSGTVDAILTVSLSAASNSAVSVNYATADGSATVQDDDYRSRSGTVTFPAGDGSPKSVSISIVSDSRSEPDETFFVNLSSPAGAAITDGQGVCTIFNDDSQCAYTFTSGSGQLSGQIFSASGGTGTITISTQEGCPWAAFLAQGSSFVTLTSAFNGSGSGTMSYSVAPNFDPNTRTAIILFGPSEQTFTVVQEGAGCPARAYTISPLTATFNEAGSPFGTSGDGNTIRVTAPPECEWTVTTEVPWITLNSPIIRLGSGTVSYSVGPNEGLWRSGTITVAGNAFTVFQVPRDCFVELVCAYFPASCPSDAALSALPLSRRFRDDVLSGSPRGKRYTELYYKFSSETVSIVTLNPLLILRSREMLQRYMPVVRSMVSGEPVTISQGDLEEIDSFLRSFAAHGSPELQETIKGLCEDLRDPVVHREFNITLTAGPKREMAAASGIHTIKGTGLMLLPLGILLLAFYRKKRNLVLRLGLSVVILCSVINLQWSVIGASEARPMIVDSALGYSTYLGGGGIEEGNSIALDSAGNIYVTGFTDSTGFPIVNASQPNFGGGSQDAFVAKLDPSGTRLLYSTYIGGNGQDNATSLAVDASGNVYVTGFTDSTNFPVKNPLQATKKGNFNAFVVKLDSSGSVVNSTLFGGSVSDYGSSIAIDLAGNVYVAGMATSPDILTANALQATPGGVVDIYVAKLDLSANRLVYSTYLGGSGIEGASSIGVDSEGNVYLTGLTSSRDFRVVNPLQATHGGGMFDAFVTKLNPSGSQVIYSTFFGGSGEDRVFRIAIDSAGSAYITGDTDSTNLPVASPLQPANRGSADAFIAKLNPSGSALVYSTYLGGSGIEGGTGVAVDSSGSAYVTGFTGSTNLPTTAPVQQAPGGGSFDGFIAKLSPGGAALDYSTYLGGSRIDSGFGVAVDSIGNAYVMGVTESANFPVQTPLQQLFGGGTSDIFITKIAKIERGLEISNATIDGKRLVVSGSGFDQGAKILVNGLQQKTANDDQNPTTTLIGKKAGKKIKRGQTAMLQVRNSDGTLSNEFSFTRPVQ
jgi:hypothetical protein